MLAIQSYRCDPEEWLQWGLDLSVEEGLVGSKVYDGDAWSVPLQWGLDLSVEEGAIGTGNNEVSPIASMGPRPFSRGRHRAVFQDHARQDLLQWGLDLSVEEGA